MKKWFTLVYIVKNIAKKKIDPSVQNSPDFLTIPEEEAIFSPSAGSIRKILDFASSYEVLESETTGTIELNTN